MLFALLSVHFVKNPGAVLEPGTIVANLELDDPSHITMVGIRYSLYYLAGNESEAKHARDTKIQDGGHFISIFFVTRFQLLLSPSQP